MRTLVVSMAGLIATATACRSTTNAGTSPDAAAANDAGTDAPAPDAADGCPSGDTPATCGPTCASCSAPDHAQPTCVAEACSFACDPGYHTCTSACCRDLSALVVNEVSSCAITASDHALLCWGELSDTFVPSVMPGLGSGVAQIAIGVEGNACVLTTAGAVKCWGPNGDGQLGNGTTASSTTPVQVTGLTSGVVQIAAGDDFACALTSAGGVKCWGNAATGELGDGQELTDRTTPVDVIGLSSGVKAIALGGFFGCALLTTGAVSCWGDLSGVTVLGPATVNVSNVVALTGGAFFACALTATGTVQCWGDNQAQVLGASDMPASVANPVTIGVSDVIAITAADESPCVLSNGAEQCWGSAELLGGAISTQSTAVPVTVPGAGSGVTQIVAGNQASHACAVIDGAVECWGYNNWGQVGNGTMDAAPTPVPVIGL
jgi:alpha-tubulin suppressor-like RCC1 family protein